MWLIIPPGPAFPFPLYGEPASRRGRQECPPSVKSWPGEAGPLGVLGALCESPSIYVYFVPFCGYLFHQCSSVLSVVSLPSLEGKGC